ncbi:hypothetical protein PG997_010769 [Apiospora hydei]|uniref:F-box domain-containing protein n=1 Tax=Apiospora hydei TaxID=1337664 RepID=A0ABR1VJV0_9PEZI
MPEGAHCYCAICGGSLGRRFDVGDLLSDPGQDEYIQWMDSTWTICWRGLDDIPVQAHISAVGRYMDNRWVGPPFNGTINPGQYRRSRHLSLYPLYRSVGDPKPFFPFHWPCFGILQRTLFGEQSVSQAELNALYGTMESMVAYSAADLALDYGFVGEDPRSLEGSHILRHLHSTDLPRDLGPKVVHDPFRRIPLEIIHMIVMSLDLADLLSLSKGSWIVNYQLRDDQELWKKILRNHIFPFYHELDDLERKEGIMQHLNAKDICVWANSSTSPDRGSETPFLGVTNRRRIWKACLQLEQVYHKFSAPSSDRAATPSIPEEFCSDILGYGHLQQVAWPLPQSEVNGPQDVYWGLLRSWKALADSSHMMSVDWHSDGTLAAIDTTPLPVSAEEHPFTRPNAAEIPRGDWIRELILHIPRFDIRRQNASFYTLLPRGVTVVMISGKEMAFGETDIGHNQRPLVASCEKNTIVGLLCRLGLVYGQTRVTQCSIVDALKPTYDNDDGEERARHDQRKSPVNFADLETDRLARYLWKEDYRELLGGIRLWNVPGLHLAYHGEHPIRKLSFESERLRTSAGSSVSRPVWCQGAGLLRSELSSRGDDETGQAATSQTIGNPCSETGWGYNLDLDRAGGEFITEIGFRPESALFSLHKCESIKITTNLREVTWGKERDESDWKHVVRAPAGERLVGLAATFGTPGWQHITQGLDALAGLSMVI